MALANRVAQPALQKPQRKLEKSSYGEVWLGARSLKHAAGHTGQTRRGRLFLDANSRDCGFLIGNENPNLLYVL